MIADVLETEYPMFCEGTRRQRGELALALLDYAKDNPSCLQQVKERLLDKKRYRVDQNLHMQRKYSLNKQKQERNDSGGSWRNRLIGGFGAPR